MTNHKPGSLEPKSQCVTRQTLLVLTGFMGTGKTAVGKRVAEKLGREFVDTDALLEAREGMTVREIFARRGETYFRDRESALCVELAAQNNLVIATGGGALVSARNREAFVHACVICLDASAAAILARVGNAADRPMLRGDARERIAQLLAARRDAYSQIARHVDTTEQSLEQVADAILEIFSADKGESMWSIHG